MAETVIAVVAAFIGVVAGAYFGWLLAQAGAKGQKQLLADREVKLAELDTERKRLENLLKAETAAKLGAEGEVSKLTGLREQDQQNFKEKLRLVAKAEEELKIAFKDLAGNTLQEVLAVHQKAAKGELDERRKAIDGLTAPINEKLKELQQLVRSSDESRGKEFLGLHKDIENLLKAKVDLQQTTDELATALRRKPGERGRWGELQLRNVIEIAGMQKFCDFTEQESTGGLRPDVTVRLPNKGLIAIDAKVTLEQYVKAVSSKEPDEAEFRAYASAVKSRVAELSKRDYAGKLGTDFDYVIMFIGHDASYDVAVEFEPELIKEAAEKNVIIATPASLIGVLRAIWIGWQEVHLAENAKQIRDLGEKLYDSLRVWAGHMNKLRKGLKDSVDAYDSAVGSLERNVFPKARQFPELGAPAKQTIEQLEPLGLEPRALNSSDVDS